MRKIAVLGYGVEGKCVETYFKKHGDEVTVFDKFTPETAAEWGLEQYDLVFRSPTVSPVKLGKALGTWREEGEYAMWENLPQNLTSVTRYFFAHCPCKIIGVTGTKGKGTTCAMITQILKTCGEKVHLVGNIGVPALTILDELAAEDVVVYEMSSFQLWDMEQSPEVAVLLRVGEDHLDVHEDLEDYRKAKENIYKYQSEGTYCCTAETVENETLIALQEKMQELLSHLSVIGRHNQEDATMALRAVAAYYGKTTEAELVEFMTEKRAVLMKALEEYKGLPHRLQLIAKKHGVEYYDDNYSSAFPALDVALKTFEDEKARVVLIAGGKDRGLDLRAMKKRIFGAECLEKVILMGETAKELVRGEAAEKYILVKDLSEAVTKAREVAEQVVKVEREAARETKVTVVMSPGAASFDMFQNFEDRGRQFQKLVYDII